MNNTKVILVGNSVLSNSLCISLINDLKIEKVIFNEPATIIKWNDGTKTIVKSQDGDEYDHEKGLAIAICKKVLGNKGNYNNIFKKWLPKKDDVKEND